MTGKGTPGPDPTPFDSVVSQEVLLRLTVQLARTRVRLLCNRLESLSTMAVLNDLIEIEGILDVLPALDPSRHDYRPEQHQKNP